MKLSITTNFAQVSRQLDALQRGVQKATARALNKTAAEAEAVMAREMQKKLGVPAAKIAGVLRIDRARVKSGRLSLRATLEVRARTGMALQPSHAAPQARSPVLSRRIAQGLRQAKGMMGKAMLRKGRGGTGPRRLRMAATLERGGAARLLHSARPRLPVKVSLNAEVARLFNDERINAKTLAAIRARFPSIFEREMRKYVERFNSGAEPRRKATPPLLGSS